MNRSRGFEAAVRAGMARSTDARSVTALAAKAGVERATIYAAFHGRQPKPDTMSAIAAALSVPVGDLWAAWEDREPVSPELLAAIERTISERMDRLGDRLERLLRELLGPGAP